MKLENLKYICELVYETSNIPVVYLDRHHELRFKFVSHHIEEQFQTSLNSVLKQIDKINHCFPLQSLIKNDCCENYFFVKIKHLNEFIGTIIVGPTVFSELTIENMDHLIRDKSLGMDWDEKFVQYFKAIPRTSNRNFTNIMKQLYYMLYQEQQNPIDMMKKSSVEKNGLLYVEDPYITISKKRENIGSFHHHFSNVKRLLQSITEGQKDQFIELYQSFTTKDEVRVLSKINPLRNSKYLSIFIITLATHAAIEGGLHYEIAYTLSDGYIQKLDDLKDIEAVDIFLGHTLGEFADRIKNNKQRKYSKPINMCLNYIYTHLSESLTLAKLANHVDLHPNYLSSLFKREVGTSISEYIQKAKVDEAKLLLKYSNHSLLKISTMLNFHDQSYFTKIFKKYTGFTPKKFKLKNFDGNY